MCASDNMNTYMPVITVITVITGVSYFKVKVSIRVYLSAVGGREARQRPHLRLHQRDGRRPQQRRLVQGRKRIERERVVEAVVARGAELGRGGETLQRTHTTGGYHSIISACC